MHLEDLIGIEITFCVCFVHVRLFCIDVRLHSEIGLN